MKTTPLRSSKNGEEAPQKQSPPLATFNGALSPIASSPRNAFKMPAGMSLPTNCGNDPEVTPESPESSWTSTLFSPVLKLFSNDSSLLASSDDSTDTNSETKSSEDDSFETKTNSETDEEMEEDDLDCYAFDPFVFMAQLPPYYLVRHNVPDPRPLPRLLAEKKPTLVLDLDETLVHCSADANGGYDVTFGVEFYGSVCQVYVKKRPHMETFLEAVCSKFEVVIFTASQRAYAEKLLDIIDPQKKYIHHRLYRESCLMVAGNLLKDLSILDRDLSKTVLVDNSPHVFGYQLDNGIPIESWYDDPNDVELLKLLPLLDQLHQSSDVRPHLRRVFRMHEMVSEARHRC